MYILRVPNSVKGNFFILKFLFISLNLSNLKKKNFAFYFKKILKKFKTVFSSFFCKILNKNTGSMVEKSYANKNYFLNINNTN